MKSMDTNINRYKRLFETAKDGIIILDSKTGKIIDANPFISKLTGYSFKELIDKFIWDIGFVKDIIANKDHFLTIQKLGYVRYENLPIQTKSGEKQHVEFISNTYLEGDNEVIQCNIRDISNRVKIEEQNIQLAMMYKVILSCNQVLLHSKTVQTIIRHICKILVSTGGFQAVMICHAPIDVTHKLKPVFSIGLDKSYFDMLNLNIKAESKENWLVKAINSYKVFICHHLKNISQSIPETQYYQKQDLDAGVVLPIQLFKNTPYALVVYCNKNSPLTKDIIELLINLTGDISYGINTLNNQSAHTKLIEQTNSSLRNTISAISSLVEQRDPYTAGHQRRVSQLAVAIAKELGLSSEKTMGVEMASIVHDIGKIHIPAEILSKPGKLTEAEFEIIKTHPKAGWEVLKNIDSPWPIAEIVYQHHERLDGSGYPRGLKGDKILLESRILMVADAIDAMATFRPYRPALGVLSALQEVMQDKGGRYDPSVVAACLTLFIEKKYQIT